MIDLDIHRKAIAETYMGIVTYRAMAECLWAGRTESSATRDIISHPAACWRRGLSGRLPPWLYARTRLARDPPRVAFTNPNTSTSGRNVLVFAVRDVRRQHLAGTDLDRGRHRRPRRLCWET